MYAFVLGAYFVVARVAAETPVLYEIAEASAFAIFYIANVIAFLGAAIVFLSFLSQEERLLPLWLSAIGLVASASAAVFGAFGLATGNDTMMFMGPGALLGYLVMGVLGWRILLGAGKRNA